MSHIEDSILIYVGVSKYECPYCKAKIDDEITYMVDKEIRFCPCCGKSIEKKPIGVQNGVQIPDESPAMIEK